MLKKVKEKIEESIFQILFGAIAGLLAIIATHIVSLVLPVLASIPNNVLLALLALSLLINIGLWFYTLHLSKQLKNLQDTKFNIGFGVLWDKDREPHCPVCKNLLSAYEEKRIKNKIRGELTCINCNKTIPLSDQDGFYRLDDAKEELKQRITKTSE